MGFLLRGLINKKSRQGPGPGPTGAPGTPLAGAMLLSISGPCYTKSPKLCLEEIIIKQKCPQGNRVDKDAETVIEMSGGEGLKIFAF